MNSHWIKSLILMAVAMPVFFPEPAVAEEYILGIMANTVQAGLGDAFGWDVNKRNQNFFYRTVAIGEPLRVFYQLDDDNDEVQTADIEIYLEEESTGKYFQIFYTQTDFHKNYTTVYDWRLPKGFKTGDYIVGVRAIVVTPAEENGVDEWEYSSTIKIVPRKKWNILNYIGADNSLSSNANGDLKEMSDNTGTSDEVNILALVDYRGPRSTHLIRLQKSDKPGDFGFVMETQGFVIGGESQTSDARTIENFARWANDQHPAGNWILTLWNHGGGWRSFNTDETPVRGSMHLFELRVVLARINGIIGGKLKVLGFDECLMAMLEVAYEFKEYAETFVASQKLEGELGWYHTGYQNYIISHPNIDDAELVARKIVESAWKSKLSIKSISAFRMNRIQALGRSVGELAKALESESDDYPVALIKAREKTVQVDEKFRSYIDLLDYVENVKKEPGNQSTAIKTAAENVEREFQRALILSKARMKNGINGLSIYYPYNIFKKWFAKSQKEYYPSPTQARTDVKNRIARKKKPPTSGARLDSDLKRYEDHVAGRPGALFAASGQPGSHWLKWITTDIVPPALKRVEITQPQEDGSSVPIYDSDNKPPAVNHAENGVIKFKLIFTEKMNSLMDPGVSFGKEGSLDSHLVEDDGAWSKTTFENDTWEGSFELPPVPELFNGTHVLTINSNDLRGNFFDTDWDKAKPQPDKGRAFNIGVAGIPYLKSVRVQQNGREIYSASWETESSGRTLVKSVDELLDLSENAGSLDITLSFLSRMDKESLRLSLANQALDLISKTDSIFEAKFSNLAKIRELALSQLPITVEGQATIFFSALADEYKLDADPRTIAYQDSSGQWKGYEMKKGTDSKSSAGGDTWHSINIRTFSTAVAGSIRSRDTGPLSGAIASVEIDGTKYSASSGANGRFQIAIPGTVPLPSSIFVMAVKPGFNTANRTVLKKDFKRVDFTLEEKSKYLVEIDRGLHHLGNNNYEGTVNSYFQKSFAEGLAYEKSFTLSEAQSPPNTVGATLLLSVKGAQELNPLTINGKKIGVLDSSNSDGSASVTKFSLDQCTLRTGKNLLTITAADSDSNDDVDDFEFTNVQLELKPAGDLSKIDEKWLPQINTVIATGRDYSEKLEKIDRNGKFWIKASGKSTCSSAREIARATVWLKDSNSKLQTVLLMETGPDTSEFTSLEAIEIAPFKAQPGQVIVVRAGIRGTNVAVVDPAAEKLAELKKILSMTRKAKEEVDILRWQLKLVSGLIDKKRARDEDVSDLVRNLNSMMSRLQEWRGRYVHLTAEHGNIESLEAEISKLENDS